MNRETTATFIGHKECFNIDEERVRYEIERLIGSGVIEFLNGGIGDFDLLCARLVHELKSKYPESESTLVIPYLTFKPRGERYFDSVVYPEGFEKHHFRAAIPARNKWLVKNSSYALCYVTHDWGGAAKTLGEAHKAGLRIKNIGNIE